jgi:hypothetical protein
MIKYTITKRMIVINYHIILKFLQIQTKQPEKQALLNM